MVLVVVPVLDGTGSFLLVVPTGPNGISGMNELRTYERTNKITAGTRYRYYLVQGTVLVVVLDGTR